MTPCSVSRPVRSGSKRSREKVKTQKAPEAAPELSFYQKYKNIIDNVLTTAVMVTVMIVVQNWYYSRNAPVQDWVLKKKKSAVTFPYSSKKFDISFSEKLKFPKKM